MEVHHRRPAIRCKFYPEFFKCQALASAVALPLPSLVKIPCKSFPLLSLPQQSFPENTLCFILGKLRNLGLFLNHLIVLFTVFYSG
ncbi:hypothetical protein CHX27_14845 [Flavobacterium aurantiibacter]|uniref:Uncharacterized protein n=1 Tax=Flavobacterium aurantiibacter TaxID=2023067 RepID=A0A255ZD68_9FLAO|nr:hypothetical protein CHX27_14845 [Flavobacterium aurantiibacter]